MLHEHKHKSTFTNSKHIAFIYNNKNAFQKDAYWPNVDRIPESAVLGGWVLPWSRGGSCLVWGVPPWSGGCLVPGGSCLVQGGFLPGRGIPPWSGGWGGTCLVPGGAWSGIPPVNRMTHASKNITLTKTSFRPVTTTTHCEFGK